MDTRQYARWFRGSTPYISAHRNKTFVVLLTGEALQHPNITHIVHDLALLHVLGVRLIVVHGARPQIAAELPNGTFHKDHRITDLNAIATIAGVHGRIRAQLEALFSTGLPNTPLHNVDVPVISGNFVVAQPIGVIDGIDHLFTGSVRRIEKHRVRATLDGGGLLLQSPLGYSSSGQAFNVSADLLAMELALQLQADKLIVFDNCNLQDAQGERISTFTPATLEQRLPEFSPDQQHRLAALIRAVRGGVSKSHLVNYTDDGALLAELFTAEGVGMQVVEQQRDLVRPATPADVSGIVEVIRPLEESGVLVRRERDRLEQEIEHFMVAELDGIVVGCCALYPFDDQAELACVAVHENYRKPSGAGIEGIGRSLLAAAEAQARAAHLQRIFVLTTHTTEWFREQGFEPANVDSLPEQKQALYNWQRNSVVLSKAIGS